MKKVFEKAKKVMTMCGVAVGSWLVFGSQAFAAGQPTIVSGTIALIQDATTWLTVIAGVVTVVMALWKGIQWQTAEEDRKPQAAHALKMTIIIGVILTVIPGLISFILCYYKYDTGKNAERQ